MKAEDELIESQQIVTAVMRIRELGELNDRLAQHRFDLGNQMSKIAGEMVRNDAEVSRLTEYLKNGRRA